VGWGPGQIRTYRPQVANEPKTKNKLGEKGGSPETVALGGSKSDEQAANRT